jgi:hypothetical protein
LFSLPESISRCVQEFHGLELVEVEVRGNHQQVDVAGERLDLTGHEPFPQRLERDLGGDAAVGHEQDPASGLCQRRGDRADERQGVRVAVVVVMRNATTLT